MLIKTNCRFCESILLDIIHLGDNFPLAGGFLRSIKEIGTDKTFPLTLCICQSCFTIQCKQVIDADILFKKDYFYFSSMLPMLVQHFQDYAKFIYKKFPDVQNTKIIEIGCNDGVFLLPLSEKGYHIVGVDPSQTILKCPSKQNIDLFNDFFTLKLANQLLDTYGEFDVFLSSNSFAHIDDMKTILNSIKLLIKNNGYIFIEVHNSKTIIDEIQFDFIYHEHMTYYTVTSMYNICRIFDLSLIDIQFTQIHGSSIRFEIQNCPNLSPSSYVISCLQNENYLTNIHTYSNFANQIEKWKLDINEILDQFQNKTIIGYGSSGRSNIICTFLNLKLKYIVDDAKSKIGNFTPLFYSEIIDSSKIPEIQPDLIIILAWPYADHIVSRCRQLGYNKDILIPLPHPKVL